MLTNKTLLDTNKERNEELPGVSLHSRGNSADRANETSELNQICIEQIYGDKIEMTPRI